MIRENDRRSTYNAHFEEIVFLIIKSLMRGCDEKQLSEQDDTIASETANTVSEGHSENMAALRDSTVGKNDSIIFNAVVLETMEKMNQDCKSGESQESSSFFGNLNYS